MLRTKVRLSFLPHIKRLRGIGRSQEQVKLTLQLLGGSIAHCKLVVFTFLPFTFLPFGDREDDRRTWKRETHTSVTEGESIAHCKHLDFTFLPFTFYLLVDGAAWRVLPLL